MKLDSSVLLALLPAVLPVPATAQVTPVAQNLFQGALLPVAEGTRRAVFGHLNGDPFLDFVIPSTLEMSVQVFLGDGSGGFTLGCTLLYPADVWSAQLLDLDSDGHLDLFTSRLGDVLNFALGDGLGGFGAIQSVSSPGPVSEDVRLVDINADSILDSVVLGVQTSFARLGSGFAAFGAYVPIDVPAQYMLLRGHAVADLNSDGDPDFITVGHGQIRVTLGQPGALFAPPQIYLTTLSPNCIDVADVNGDGVLDIVTGDGALYYSVLIGSGNGSFAAPRLSAAGGTEYTTSLALIDVNDDNLLDVVASSDSYMRVHLGNGQGDFTAHSQWKAGYYNDFLVKADIDLDGRVDIANCSRFSRLIQLLRNTGSGGFEIPYSDAMPGGPACMALEDVDHDGRKDLIAGNFNSRTVSVRRGTGTTTFGAASSFTTTTGPTVNARPQAIALSDLNGDGNSDILTGNVDGSISRLYGDGLGGFGAPNVRALATQIYGLVLADFTGDGVLDVAAADPLTQSLHFAAGAGNGTFAAAASVFAAGCDCRSIQAARLNADNALDLVLGCPSGSIVVLLGDGAGSFPTRTTYPTANGVWGLEVADLNADGNLDVAATCNLGSALQLGFGDGAGNLVLPPAQNVGYRLNGLAIADFDGDAQLDLAAVANRQILINGAKTTQSVLIWRGAGTGQFSAPTHFDIGFDRNQLLAHDVNEDGRLDLVALSRPTQELTVVTNLRGCPAPQNFCTASTSTNGCASSLHASGAPSASATSGFMLVASSVEGDKSGLIFYGASGMIATPWGSGWLCVKAPTQRTPITNSGGASGTCQGTLSLDWSAFVSGNPTAIGAPQTPGAVYWAQGWFRDPAATKSTTLTSGLSFTLCP